jgi:hypothetical protein
MDSSEITTNLGRVVGHWDGKSARELQDELARIKRELAHQDVTEKVLPTGIPHSNQMPSDLRSFTAYLIWGCDANSDCLCGANANRIVSVKHVRQYSLIDHH